MIRRQQLPLGFAFFSLANTIALLAVLQGVMPTFAKAQEQLDRSMSAEPLMRHNDKRDRPRVPERQTHRGWEVLRDTFTVVCGTSREDALLVANHFEQAWDETTRLLDPWTRVHTNPDFGLGSAEITIDPNPIKNARDQAAPMLQVNSNLMIVYCNVAGDRPSLQEQLPQLRMAAVYTLMHTSHFDEQLPTWVRDGLAVFVAEKCAELNGGPRTSNPPLVPLDSEYWKRKRISRFELEERPPPSADSAGQVRFLLEGFDCRFAPAMFASLRETINQSTPGLDLETRNSQRGAQAPSRTTVVDLLIDRLRPQYESWQRDPLAGQPIITPMGNENQQIANAERELAVVLKLARRFGPKTNSVSVAPVDADHHPATHVAGHVKITEFKRGTAEDIAPGQTPAVSGQGAPQVPQQPAVARLNMQQIYERMAASSIPWATLDADGHVLLSVDRNRVQELLGVGSGSLSIETRNQQVVARKALPAGGAIEGWLEENKTHPSRPFARFARAQADAFNR